MIMAVIYFVVNTSATIFRFKLLQTHFEVWQITNILL